MCPTVFWWTLTKVRQICSSFTVSSSDEFTNTHVHNFTFASALILFVFLLTDGHAQLWASPGPPPESLVPSPGHNDWLWGSPLQGHLLCTPTVHPEHAVGLSLTYLKSLVNDNCFQPEGIKPSVYSSSTAILIVYSCSALANSKMSYV